MKATSFLKSGNRKSSCCLVIFFCISFIYGQENPSNQKDSLSDKEYKYFFNQIGRYRNKDNHKAILYSKSFLNKTKIEKDSLYSALAYYYLSVFNTTSDKILMALDSAQIYIKKQNNNNIKAHIYNRYGSFYFDNGRYKKALDNYIEAKKLTDEKRNKALFYDIEYNIGLIKTKIRDFQGAKENFKKYYNYLIKNNLQQRYKKNYVNTLGTLSSNFRRTRQIDSAIYYNNIAIKVSEKNNDIAEYVGLKVADAIYNYDLKNYKQTFDSITKYLPDVKRESDSMDLAMAYLYLGKVHFQLYDKIDAVALFKKVDTIVQKSGRYNDVIRENYLSLRNYYKEENDLKNQLVYVERLIKFDSILYDNNDYLKTILFDKYETPKLLEERENLVSDLKIKGKKRLLLNYLLAGLVILLSVSTIYYYRKKIVYKKRFKKILKTTSNFGNEKKSETKKPIALSEETVKDILGKLEKFESEKRFIDNNLTLNSVAKSMKTNSNYLSKIINTYKGKNFSAYISELRIKYTIRALKENPKLREYTIKAIAFEVGFKNVDSFTIAFYKHTRLYPSYFIKELRRQEIT